MSKISTEVLVILILLGILLRIYRFDNPIADWHSWRQSDTSAVSIHLVRSGFDFLHPKYFDISNIQSGLENPQGYRFVEFPIYNLLQAGSFVFLKNIITLSIEQWGRVITILSSVLASVFLFLLVRKYANEKIAFLASFFYLTLPYSVYYGRSILPDPTMATAVLGGIFFFDKWLDDNSKIFKISYFLLTTIFTASALLLKPFAIFFVLPMVYLAFKKFGFSILKRWELYLFMLLSLTPLVAWRFWIAQWPSGIPASDWLFNAGNIRFKGAFFYWIFAERISKLILGYFGIVFLFLGLIVRKTKINYPFFASFLLSSLLYLVVIARGNVQHDYYQILIMPTISIFLALGVYSAFEISRVSHKIIGFIYISIFLVFTYAFSFFQVRDYFNINNENIVVAGQKANELLPKDALVIAPYDGDTTFLYQTKRQGWPAFTDSIEKLIEQGASYLVLASPTQSDFEGFGRQYETVASSEAYLILRLK